MGLCRHRDHGAWRRADSGTGYSWLKAVFLFGRDYLPAFGICKNPVSVLHSRHTLGGFLLKKYSYQRSGGSRPRAHPRSVKGFGERFDILRGVCIRCV